MQKMDIDWTIVGPFTDLKKSESKWFLPETKLVIHNKKRPFGNIKQVPRNRPKKTRTPRKKTKHESIKNVLIIHI
jgi:hypothetical protein